MKLCAFILLAALLLAAWLIVRARMYSESNERRAEKDDDEDPYQDPNNLGGW